jgi:hypothetical protein
VFGIVAVASVAFLAGGIMTWLVLVLVLFADTTASWW